MRCHFVDPSALRTLLDPRGDHMAVVPGCRVRAPGTNAPDATQPQNGRQQCLSPFWLKCSVSSLPCDRYRKTLARSMVSARGTESGPRQFRRWTWALRRTLNWHFCQLLGLPVSYPAPPLTVEETSEWASNYLEFHPEPTYSPLTSEDEQ